MHTVQQVLEQKTHNNVISVAPDDTVFTAIQTMADNHIGAVLVMEGKRLTGIFSERDYAREIILKGRASHDTPVREIMSIDVITAIPEDRVRGSLSVMTDKRIRHLPVVNGDEVIGVISIGDLVKDVISDQQATIEQLENYIRG